MSGRPCMLTTIDNPYDPFTDFVQWYLYDMHMGYNSSGLLARLQKTSEQLSDEENNSEIESTIDGIIKNDPLNIYKKVYEN